MNANHIHYGNILSRFKIEWDTYENLKKENDLNVLLINDKENDNEVNK